MSRKEQAETSRAALVAAARQCFAADGYDATTVASILRAAGMARGALYHYFPEGKRDIFSAVFDELNDDYHRRRDASAEVASPLGRITAGMNVFLICCTQPDFAQIVLADAPRLIPSQALPGSSYRLLLAELDQAVAAQEIQQTDTGALAMILHGAVRSAGDFVVESSDPAHALIVAGDMLKLLVDGLRR
jgi:AcrR family transcriptional regulator